MLELIIKIGELVVANLLQILAGCLLSLPIYRFASNLKVSFQNSFANDIFMIFASVLLGMMLPLDIFGFVPIIAALYSAGARIYVILPVIFSNVIFNMLVPFNDVSFVWRTGIRRVILAFIIGSIAGLVFKILKVNSETLLRKNNLTFRSDKAISLKNIMQIFADSINATGIYLIFGVLFNQVFHKYILFNTLDFIFSNPNTAYIPYMFTKYDVVNPLFLLAINIMLMFINFTKISAVILLLKPKGLKIFVGYFLVWAVLLAIPAFIKY